MTFFTKTGTSETDASATPALEGMMVTLKVNFVPISYTTKQDGCHAKTTDVRRKEHARESTWVREKGGWHWGNIRVFWHRLCMSRPVRVQAGVEAVDG